jgi:hypothetical protein
LLFPDAPTPDRGHELAPRPLLATAVAVPVSHVGAGQSVLFAALFRVVFTDVTAHRYRQRSADHRAGSGMVLGVATLGTLCISLQPDGSSRSFAVVDGVRMVIVALLAASVRVLPHLAPVVSVLIDT